MDNNYPYITGMYKRIFEPMRKKVDKYNQDLLEEALTANESRKDFDGARLVINIYNAERINNDRQ